MQVNQSQLRGFLPLNKFAIIEFFVRMRNLQNPPTRLWRLT